MAAAPTFKARDPREASPFNPMAQTLEAIQAKLLPPSETRLRSRRRTNHVFPPFAMRELVKVSFFLPGLQAFFPSPCGFSTPFVYVFLRTRLLPHDLLHSSPFLLISNSESGPGAVFCVACIPSIVPTSFPGEPIPPACLGDGIFFVPRTFVSLFPFLSGLIYLIQRPTQVYFPLNPLLSSEGS